MSTQTQEFAKGWPIVFASAMGVGVGITGLPFYTFGVFMKPLGQEFGWSRASISMGMLFLNAGVVLTGPFLGQLIDRHGVRAFALTSLVGLAIGFAGLSSVGPGIGGFYGAWLALALLGCATSPLTWTRAIALNFDTARGLALGVTLLGTGLSSLIGPPLVQMVIAHYGWRGGYIAEGLFVLLVVLPLVFFCLHEHKPGQASAPGDETVPVVGMSYRETLRSRRFWLIGAGIFCVILAQASATVHLVPLLSDRGISAVQGAGIMGLLGAGVIIGRIVVGLMLDRFHGPKVARVFLGLPAISMLLLLVRHDSASAAIAALLLGLAAGAEVDLLSYLVSRYFGMRSYGAIYGTLLSLFGLGAGLGPVMTGKAFDAAGSYDPALQAGMLLFIVGAAAIGFLGRYPDFAHHSPNGGLR